EPLSGLSCGPAAGDRSAHGPVVGRADRSSPGREDRGALWRPGKLAPALGPGTRTEGVALDAVASGDGLPQLLEDDPRRNLRSLPCAGADCGPRREHGAGG